MAREDAPGDKRLVAYVVGEAVGRRPSPRRLCATHLRADVCPSTWCRRTSSCSTRCPRTPNGKIDRKALPAPSTVARGWRPPPSTCARRTSSSRRSPTIWQEILKVPQVGTSDNFFDLGGHSLLAVQVHGGCARVAPRELSITDLFRFPTIRELGRDTSARKTGMTAAVKKRSPARRRSAGRQSMALPRRPHATGTIDPQLPTSDEITSELRASKIAVVGMAGRFPGRAHARRVLEQPAGWRRIGARPHRTTSCSLPACCPRLSLTRTT